jgi:hypothetical protein
VSAVIVRGTRATAGVTLALLALLLGAVDSAGQARHQAAHKPKPKHKPAHAAPHHPVVKAGPSVARFAREPFPYSAPVSVSTEAKRYSVMVLLWTDGAMVRRLHAANHHLKILVYADAILDRINDPFASCTDYKTNVSSHPDWFLKDASGQRIQSRAYAGNVLMDVGNAAYRQACVAHTIALAKRFGFDGVYFDDVTAWVGWSIPGGLSAPEYPTPAAWQPAMSAFVAYAASQAHAQGLLAIGNIGGSVIAPGLWQRWTSLLDGSEEQSWTDAGLGLTDQIFDWRTKLANVAWSEAHRKYTVLHSYNTTTAGNEYGLASMLLVAGGWSGYSITNRDYAEPEMWRGIYGQAKRLGAPLGPYRRLGNGVYQRKFARGLVLVNPTAGSVGRFSLRGAYRDSGGARSTSIAMGPTTGAILLTSR